ncbi:MAG TPA: hypothetical protein VGL94_20080 [Ktedonobacteraceae bacterium]|jgi:putative DNA methylase
MKPKRWNLIFLLTALQRSFQLDIDGAAKVLGGVGDLSGVVRDLAYRLYAICERKSWVQEALAYNILIASWSGISDQARKLAVVPQQATLNLN